MDYDIKYFAGKDLVEPRYPTTSFPIHFATTPEKVKQYAEELEAIQPARDQYAIDNKKYHEALEAREEEFKQTLQRDFGLNDKQFNLIYEYVLEITQGEYSRYGWLYEVAKEFEDLCTLIADVNAA